MGEEDEGDIRAGRRWKKEMEEEEGGEKERKKKIKERINTNILAWE